MVEKLEPKGGKPENPEGFRNNHDDDLRADKYRNEEPNGKHSFADEERKDRPRYDRERRSRSRSSRGSRRGSPGYHGSMHSRSRSRSSRYSRNRRSHDRHDQRKRANSDDGRFTQIYVTGYSHSVNEEDLRKHFSEIGPIKEVLMKRGFSFIEYKFPEHAALAVKHLDGQTFGDKNLTVERSSKLFIIFIFFLVPGGGRRRRITGPQVEDQCWGCGKSGHW
jgi:hypothetical protein